MNEAPKSCPQCGVVLEPGHKNGLATFSCPGGHGVGISLTEAYADLQRDELEAIWDGARQAPQSKLRSPIDGRLMVEVTFTVDDDPRYGASAHSGREMTIEVDIENRFGWFSLEELRAMPTDRPVATGLVGLGELSGASNDAFFNSLTPDDYVQEDEDDYYEPRSSGIFGGLARRLRG